jgi:carbon-monoxide dehydrogenase medium subunit
MQGSRAGETGAPVRCAVHGASSTTSRRRYAYLRPRTLDEAFELEAATEGARWVAGATDVMVKIRGRVLSPRALISLRGVDGLAGVDVGEQTRIGATTTVADLLAHETLGREYPVLAEAAARLGSPQIRSVATVGGNLCNASPCADLALALLVLEARVGARDAGGSREIPIERFFLGPGRSCLEPGEVATHVTIPKPAAGVRSAFLKKGRVRMDLAIASLAVVLDVEAGVCRRARIGAGSVAPVPLRLREAESVLEGKSPSAGDIDRARAAAERAVTPISDVRSSAAYRRHIVGVYVRRALESLLARREP